MYGLVGKKLGHSFSKEIHHLLGNKIYKLHEISNLEDFLNKKEFKGINVTIPYKTEVLPHLDEIDDIARETKSVNTIINENGKLKGYNTDYFGLKSMLSFYNISIQGKSVIILGNGSVSNTVLKLLKDLKCKRVIRLARNIKTGVDDCFENVDKYLDYNVVINTTPVGMYPNNTDELLIDLTKLDHLEVYVDLIYNPLRTKMMIVAENLGAKSVNGLYMLVMQAKHAHELFFKKDIPLNVANQIYKKIFTNMVNYVFVGLPLSGKSKYANILGKSLNKKVTDMDSTIESTHKMSIPTIFKELGEKTFRQYETDLIIEMYQSHSMIISTGGGVIESQANMDLLKQNGVIIYLDKNPEDLAKKVIYGRPLIKKSEDILNLAKKRIPLYTKNSDIIITLENETNKNVNAIKDGVYEYTCNKWS